MEDERRVGSTIDFLLLVDGRRLLVKKTGVLRIRSRTKVSRQRAWQRPESGTIPECSLRQLQRCLP